VLDGGLEKPDGVQQYIIYLSKYFESLGHKTRYIVAGKVPNEYKNAVSLAKNITVKSNGNKLKIPFPSSSKVVKSYLAKEKFDVLHIQTPYSPMMGEKLILHADKNTAIVGTYHIIPSNWYLSFGNKLLGLICIRSLKRFDKMLSVSEPARVNAKRDFKIDSEVIPNVIDFKKFNTAKPSLKKPGVKTILFFGRLVERKGCLELLKAIKIIQSKDIKLPKYRVLICGTGPLETSLKKYVLDNDISELVSFRGYIEEKDKPAIYASADISVFPAIKGESFGIVLLEALSSGKAVVLGGNNVGYASVLSEQPELLFNPKDNHELADLLETYLTDNKARLKKAKWGETYARNFDVKVVGDKILEVYKTSLLKRPNQ
jgi:phosphatidylinositol alpha-mannosyltransferase